MREFLKIYSQKFKNVNRVLYKVKILYNLLTYLLLIIRMEKATRIKEFLLRILICILWPSKTQLITPWLLKISIPCQLHKMLLIIHRLLVISCSLISLLTKLRLTNSLTNLKLIDLLVKSKQRSCQITNLLRQIEPLLKCPRIDKQI